jgi:hypothetical protein
VRAATADERSVRFPVFLRRWRGWSVAASAVVSPFRRLHGTAAVGTILLFVMFQAQRYAAGVMTILSYWARLQSRDRHRGEPCGLAATLVSAAAGNACSAASAMRAWICGLLQMLSNLTFAAQAHVGHSVPMLTLTIGLENLAGGMGTAAFVAYLSSLCNVPVHGNAVCAAHTSLMSAARGWLSSGANAPCDSTDWTTFYVLTTLAAVPGPDAAAASRRGRSVACFRRPARVATRQPAQATDTVALIAERRLAGLAGRSRGQQPS